MTAIQKTVAWILLFLALEAILIAFIDKPVSLYLRAVEIEYQAFIDFFRSFTDLGKSVWYFAISGCGILVCATLLRFKNLRREVQERVKRAGHGFLFLLACLAASGIAADILKPLIGRARPVVLDREGLYMFHPLSFDAQWNAMPSGHATTAITVACVLISLAPRYRWLWATLGVVLALSRVMVNAHYLSDVVAGSALGVLIVLLLKPAINHNGMVRVGASIFPIDRKQPLS